MRYELASSYEKFIWDAWKKEPRDSSLFLQYSFEIQGQINHTHLIKILKKYVWLLNNKCGGYFYLNSNVLYKAYPEPLQQNEVEFIDVAELNVDLKNFLKICSSSTINIETGPLCKLLLIKISNNNFLLNLTFSHIIFDGLKYNAFRKFLENYYNNQAIISLGEVKKIESVSKQNDLDSEIFWRQYLAEIKLHQNLSFFRNRNNSLDKNDFLKRKVIFTPGELQSIVNIKNKYKFSWFHFLTAILTVFIGKYNNYSSMERMTLGYTVNNGDQENLFGCFTNFNPISIEYDPSEKFLQLLNKIMLSRKKIKPHQHFSFMSMLPLVDKIYKGKLLNVLINNSPGLIGFSAPDLKDLVAKVLECPSTDGPYDLGLIFNYNNEHLFLELSVPNVLSTNQQMDELVLNFKNIFYYFSGDLEASISNYNLQTLFPVIDNQKTSLESAEDITEIFKKSFEKNSQKIAVVFENYRLSYDDLLSEVNLLSSYLINLKPQANLIKDTPVVGIYLNRSHYLLIAVLSSIMARYCFIPLDPEYPAERLDYILEQSNINFIISDTETLKLLPLPFKKKKITLLLIDAIKEQKIIENDVLINSKASLELQYILFTSGSTGHPKGVMISRRNLNNFLLSMKELKICGCEDYLFSMTSLNFDIALLELLLPIATGATVEIASVKSIRDSALLEKSIEKIPVTIIQATPSTWKMLVNIGWHSGKPLKILTGGENLEDYLAKYLLDQGHRLYNMYGPTEATIWSSFSLVDNPTEISIGIPIHNSYYHILSPNKNPCPLGIPGELYIQGDGVGLGYLNSANNHNFMLNQNGKLYKTGDLVCYYGDSYIKFIRRIDNQIKLRGYRIELEEITNTICLNFKITNVITLLRKKPEEYLVTFIQASAESVNLDAIKKCLSNNLPPYMVPQRIEILRNFPLTLNKKVDVKYLETEPMENVIAKYSERHLEKKLSPIQSSYKQDSILDTIVALFKESCEVSIEPFCYDMPLGHFGLNSINFNLLALKVSESFSVSFSPHQFYTYSSVNKLASFLKNVVSAAVADGRLEKEISLNKTPTKSGVSIIGTAALLPIGTNLKKSWQEMMSGHSAVKSHTRKYLSSDLKAGFLDNIESFDANFFNISPLEAMAMDPQQRLILQAAWQTLEDSGYKYDEFEGKNIGVYAAVTGFDYYSIQKENFSAVPYTMPGVAHSILANRLSYFFGWNGPSITIDTACSGSLIALVRAYQDLIDNRVNYAFVCSANIILDQNIQQALQASHLLSPNFRCAAFDESADGYVRGEGVGCVLLKRYEDAIKDEDNCYGVIVSAAENHGGRSHSLTAPNPEAQKALLLKAYHDTKLAKRVSFIEAHGTGTKLGDPIEVDALKQAWKELGITKLNSVALGSVKSCIGHLEPAAGIASLLKVLLCLKHKTLPGNLHFKSLNQYVDLKESPFYVLSQNQPWDSEGLRVAGISSFGFGGSNAHVVVEEAPQRPFKTGTSKPAYLVCISARSLKSLSMLIQSLVQDLEETHMDENYNLANIAFTLNYGRSHFEYRFACIVKDIEELKVKLKAFAEGTVKEVVLNKSIYKVNLANCDFEEAYLRDLYTLKVQYLEGNDLEWLVLHQQEPKLRLSLPLYSFDTQSYWFEEQGTYMSKNNVDDYSILHLENGVYNARIKKNHVWLSDHIVNDKKILPGAAHLAIVFNILLKFYQNLNVGSFSNIIWINPIICEEEYLDFLIKIDFSEQLVEFKIYSNSKEFSSGQLNITKEEMLESLSESNNLQISDLYFEHALSQDKIYHAFNKSGIKYGDFFKGIKAIKNYSLESCITKIFIPHSIERFKVNLLDSIFQSVLGLSLTNLNEALLPFSLGDLKLSSNYFLSNKDTYYAVVEKKSAYRVNIKVFDEDGKFILFIKDFGVKSMNTQTFKRLESNDNNFENLSDMVYKPVWRLSKNPNVKKNSENCYIILHAEAEAAKKFMLSIIKFLPESYIFSLDDKNLVNKVNNIINQENFTEIWLVDDNEYGRFIAKNLYQKALKFIEFLQNVTSSISLSVKVITRNGVLFNENDPSLNPNNSILLGLAQTAAKEFPNIKIYPVSIADNEITEEIVGLIKEENSFENPLFEPIILSESQRYIRNLVPSKLSFEKSNAFKENGVYMIIGGLGGIGSSIAKYLLKEYKAHIILVGRRDADAINEYLNELKTMPGKVSYEQVNIIDAFSVDPLIEKYPIINGIIHSALILKDKTIKFMDELTFKNVLEPKVQGSINLLEALKKHEKNVDFILFLSSIQSFIANPGQSNYTCACVFKDALAHFMRNLYLYETKIINWGYWGNIGVVAKVEYREKMEKLGIGSIEVSEGLKIIESFLASDLYQIAVIKAEKNALKTLNIGTYMDKKAIDFSNLDSETSNINTSDFLKRIMPEYQPDNPFIIRNHQAQRALEKYTRYAAKNVRLPETYLAKYKRLVFAIQNMSFEEKINKEELLIHFPEIGPHIHLIDHCLASYEDVLMGKKEHMVVLFPDGKFDMVEPIYRNNPASDYFNKIVSQIVINYLDNTNSKNPRIIEIGAGTGSTTQFVMPRIEDKSCQYYFTDLSFAFLKKAQELFSGFRNLQYKIYNVENSPSDDLKNNFDIVIATNVLHATSNISNTIENVKNLLKSGGILILNEVTSRQDFATVTFGLTAGWWMYEDHRIPDSPLLTRKTWGDLLKKAGFSFIHSHGEEEQNVIVAYLGEELQNDLEASHLTVNEKILSSHADSFSKSYIKDEKIYKQLEGFIVNALEKVMKISRGEIKFDLPFSNYGIDSLITLQLLKPFQEKFGYVPSTIFFEYPSVAKLRDFFLDQYKDVVEKAFFLNQDLTLTDELNNKSTVEELNVFLKNSIGQVMKIDPKDIKDDVVLKNYGIDSLITLEVLKPLIDFFGYLPSTLLFEYPTIKLLEQYFFEKFPEKVKNAFCTNQLDAKNLERFKAASIAKTALPAVKNTNQDDIAIIGMAVRLPEAENVEQFWSNLVAGKNCIIPIPKERWNNEAFYDDNYAIGKIYTQYGGFLKDIECFDSEFFNITPYDAENIDPQERLFLQTTYHAMEDSGYAPSMLSGKDVGVFVGIMNGGYGWLGVDTPGENWADSLYWSIANRISYSFDWHGPSVAIDTACSSSLTALHLACQSIRNDDCFMAVVGGVNLIVHPKQYTKLCRLRMLTREDKCKAFGNNADGFVDGEGIISIVLKRYSDAIKDKDRIYGIIKGSAVNAGGKANGYTVPNPNAQAELVRKALQRAKIPADHVSYVEAHGTGTELGDPIEIRGLTKAFQTEKVQFCALGSLKSNIGHLESAAGLAGIAKVILQMRNKSLVPTLHAEVENPHLSLTRTPFYLVKGVTPWQTHNQKPLVAIVNSFGAGGANACVVLESVEIPQSQQSTYANNFYLIPISAKNILSLHSQIYNLKVWLESKDNVDMYALAYTLSCCKEHFNFRVCFLVNSYHDLIKVLEEHLTMLSNVSVKEIQDSNRIPNINDKISSKFDHEVALEVKHLYENGYSISWTLICPERVVLSLPGYYFENKFHWLNDPKHGLPIKERYIKHHALEDKCLVPASLGLSLVFQEKKSMRNIQEVHWLKPMLQLENNKIFIENNKFNLVDWSGEICIKGEYSNDILQPFSIPWGEIVEKFSHTKVVDKKSIYNYFSTLGYNYGKTYQKLCWIKNQHNSALGAIEGTSYGSFEFSPEVFDAALQVAIMLFDCKAQFGGEFIMVPKMLKNLCIITKNFEKLVFCYMRLKNICEESKEITMEFSLFNAKGEIILHCDELISKAISKAYLKSKMIDLSSKISNETFEEKEKIKVYELN